MGQLGQTVTTAEGQAAARAMAIDLMGTLQAACQAAGGDLDNVKRIVKVMSLVNSTADFTEQHLVTNGCCELLARCSATRAPMRAALSAWRRFPWGPAWRSN